MSENEDRKQQASEKEVQQNPGLAALAWDAFKHVITHNVWMKILAIAISVILWAGLISQDESLTRERTFSGVNVSVIGTETMKRNGYIVTSDLEKLLQDVSVVAAVPQKEYDNAEPSAYNIRVDLSRITGTGRQELQLLRSNSQLYGRVLNTSPASVQVDVEDYVMRQRIPVSVSVGKTPEDRYLSTPTVDPTVVTISGPKSVVENISRARAYLDTETIDWNEDSILTSVQLELYNKNGDPVSDSLMEVTSENLIIDSVLVEASILPTRTFDVTGLIATTDSVARGSEIKELRISPESIKVAAPEEVLEQMTELALDSRTVSVRNLKETKVFRLKVQKPSDDAVLSNDTITVTVEIGPIGE